MPDCHPHLLNAVIGGTVTKKVGQMSQVHWVRQHWNSEGKEQEEKVAKRADCILDVCI